MRSDEYKYIFLSQRYECCVLNEHRKSIFTFDSVLLFLLLLLLLFCVLRSTFFSFFASFPILLSILVRDHTHTTRILDPSNFGVVVVVAVSLPSFSHFHTHAA